MELTYDWKLSDIYPNAEAALADFEKLKKLDNEVVKLKGKLNNKKDILRLYKLNDQSGILGGKIGAYFGLRRELNGKDTEALKALALFSNYGAQIGPKLAFIEEEMSSNSDEFLRSLAADKDFKDYEIDLQNIIEQKPHVLPEQVQSVLDQNQAFGGYSDVFDNFNDVDIKFEDVIKDGKRKKLTHATYSLLVKDKDQSVRKMAYENTHKAYGNFNYTLSEMYLNGAKESLFFSKIRKYNSVFEARSSADKSTPEVLNSLFKVVHDHLGLYHEYEKLLKKALNLKTFYYFDNYAQVSKLDKKFTYEDAANIVIDALSVMGEDYVNNIKKALCSGWIDVYEKPGKRSGGFNMGLYSVHPYILLNHENNYNAVSTLIHELGHAMHSVYTDSNQPLAKSSASIMASEVASTVNEVLLVYYMLDHAKTREEKLFYINQFLSNFVATVYRQTMFAEFEHFVFGSLENGVGLTAEDLNNKYASLQELYYGKVAHKTDNSKYEWSRIPHFYRPYYVYKYSTGFIAACTIARKILAKEEGYLEKYINYLKAGCSVWPLELLKSVDVDLQNPNTLSQAFDLFEDMLGQLKKLI